MITPPERKRGSCIDAAASARSWKTVYDHAASSAASGARSITLRNTYAVQC